MKRPRVSTKEEKVSKMTYKVLEMDVESKEFRKTFKKFFELLSEEIIVNCKDAELLQQWMDILEGDGPGMCNDAWNEENEGFVQEYLGMIQSVLDELDEEK